MTILDRYSVRSRLISEIRPFFKGVVFGQKKGCGYVQVDILGETLHFTRPKSDKNY